MLVEPAVVAGVHNLDTQHASHWCASYREVIPSTVPGLVLGAQVVRCSPDLELVRAIGQPLHLGKIAIIEVR